MVLKYKSRSYDEGSSLPPPRRARPKPAYPQKYLTRMKSTTRNAAVKHARRLPFEVKPGESELQAAKRWLTKLLYRGHVYNHDVHLIAQEAGLSFKLLEKAKNLLGVEYRNINVSARRCWSLWAWELPAPDEDDDQLNDEEEARDDDY